MNSLRVIPNFINLIDQDFSINEYTKFLGVNIDLFLKWDKHIY